MENPVKFAEELILVTQGKRSSPVQEQEQMNSPFTLSSLLKKIQSNARIKKVCIGKIKDLMEVVNNADCILENLDPMERTVVEDLREVQKKDFVNVTSLVQLVLSCFSDHELTQYVNDINLRHLVLTCVKQATEVDKYFMRLREAAKEPDIWRQMLNPASENPFGWNLLLPAGHGLEEDYRNCVLHG